MASLSTARAGAETLPLPPNAMTGASENAELNAVICPATGQCVAVGGFIDTANAPEGLIATESGGSWTSSEVSLGSLAGHSPASIDVGDISCPSAGRCLAIGSYEDSAGQDQGLLLEQNGSNWTATKAPLPAASPAPHVHLESVSCSSPGTCVVVGYYEDSGSDFQGLILQESNGLWTATKAPLTSPATDPEANLYAVSCGSSTSCVAIGNYTDSLGHDKPLVESLSGGSLSQIPVDLSKLPSYASVPSVYLSAVNCASAGNCTAVGAYLDGSAGQGSYQGLLLTESGGTWSPAQMAPLPANAYTNGTGTQAQQDLELNAVSCSSAGNCTAVGRYDAGGTFDAQGLELTQTGGVWQQGAETALPVPGPTDPKAYLGSVTCQSAGNCLATGAYLASDGSLQAIIARQSSGSWSSTATPVASAASSHGFAGLRVACASSGYCAAAGYVSPAGAAITPLLFDPPAAPTSAAATTSGTSAQVSWTAPADTGGLPLTGYTITASDLTAASRGGQSVTVGVVGSATVPGLTPGDTYTFTITPTSVLGNGLPVSTAGVLVPLPPVPPPTVVSFSATQLTASLAGLLVPHGPGSRLSKLARTHGYTFKWTPLEAGTATVRWYAKTGKGRHRRRHLIGSGTTTASAATAIAVHVRLNRTGRRLVKTDRRLHRRLHVTASVSFTAGTTTVTATHAFTLH